MAASSGSTKVCFNSTCKEPLEVPKQGWLCRTGDFADLCDRCAFAFKDGNFCDTYHSNASGWRSCESCGKQIHCGCIVSFHMFILLDAGGIECLNCAKTEYILTPNPTWPPVSHFLTGPAERIRDISSKNWRSIMTGSKPQPELQSRTPFVVDILNSIDNPSARERLTSYSLGKSTTDDHSERVTNENWQVCPSEMIGERVRTTSVQYDGKRNLFGDIPYQSFFNGNELATPLSTMPATFVAHDQKSEKLKSSGYHVQRQCSPSLVGKRCSNYSGAGPSLEVQAHNANSLGEPRGRHQPLPRYWPRITDQNLQQTSGSSNARITPLFEKVLSASDAGRIGRLVLPKKCAEAYLPPISQPEGYPLVVQDLKGKDWVLQFRYWPNNNSRMYVLEGVTPCIQSMGLQAGDIVTFSRLEPEGKLIMGFRKASLASSSYQGNGMTSTRICTHEEPLKGSIGFKSKNPDSAESKGDKISIGAKRKKGKLCSDSKYLKHDDREMFKLNVTLEQLQGLLRPPLTNTPTVVLIEGVEFEDFQESPVIGSPMICSENHVESLCSPEVEPTPQHLERTLPMINHVSSKKNESENPESVETMVGLDELDDLAIPDGKAIPASSQSTTRHPHKSTCTCNVCLAVRHSMQMMRHDQKHSEEKVKIFIRNPPQLPHADILRYKQVGSSNQNLKRGPSESFENGRSGENSSAPSFKSQNIDLNIQPEREEESCPVSDSTGIMRIVQESTHR